jgi:phosphoglucosamine mutase
MNPPFFGTDGIRDAVSGPLLQPAFVRRVGVALATWLHANHSSARSLHAVIGRDTRESGPGLVYALCQGLAAGGIKIFDAGVAPTPAIAKATIDLQADLGIVITASHNPASDNGIKLFLAAGTKLSQADEADIERLIQHAIDPGTAGASPAVMLHDARRHYEEFLIGQFPAQCLMGLRLVVDCSNGATWQSSPRVLTALGAHVELLGCQPDGLNINRACGSEHPAALQQAVIAAQADVGIAHDGDGDRLIVVDDGGSVVDGDGIMALIAAHGQHNGWLTPPYVVTTVMSNAGLDAFLRQRGIQLLRSEVGDRNVAQMMALHGAPLGGEASGHFICRHILPTGDGLIAALLLLAARQQANAPLSSLITGYKPWPQLKLNLRVAAKPPLETLPALHRELAALEASLPIGGRILLRYSGTEPKIRLLAETPDPSSCQQTLDALQAIVIRHLPLIP